MLTWGGLRRPSDPGSTIDGSYNCKDEPYETYEMSTHTCICRSGFTGG